MVVSKRKKTTEHIGGIQQKILAWYKESGRKDLPWRKTNDMYHIAVSEIMLQQTNVPKVIQKYAEFLSVFPTVEVLANAPQSDVLQQWSGLGYNRRAIYLHRMAQDVVREHGGVFPQDPEQLVQLYGVGPYTSRSIPIFARNADMATHDVNIVRIFRRIHKDMSASDAKMRQWTEEYLPHGHSRDWHNALMDFASLICTKRSPACATCPIAVHCRSYPCPQDMLVVKKKEIGRLEKGKHVPRRIYRGRIIEFLRSQSADVLTIGKVIKKDWHSGRDAAWCDGVLRGLEKDHMITDVDGIWSLR